MAVMAPAIAFMAAILGRQIRFSRRAAARGQILSHGRGEAKFQRVGDESVANRNFLNLRHVLEEETKVQQVQVMAGVNLKAGVGRTARRRGKFLDKLLVAARERRGER